MGSSRRSFKKRKAKVRVGLPSNKPFKISAPPALHLPNSGHRLEWNDKGTRLANYRSLGLVANPNLLGARSGSEDVVQLASLQKFREEEQMDQIDGSDMEADDVKSALGKKRKDGKRNPLQRLTLMQRVYVGRLIEKYGNDFEAMARDIKLNKMQHSSGSLKKLCARFHGYHILPDSTLNT
ncbi:hypothetical protein O6H91_16G007700 [Diphasiastrum complanatum]|uniref:Uncharacterized protein n=1 Tax=Diphasiastrum complanatum TaxID=34168 RepID=A0ACC2B9P6_DIPCM|nr:hypothetical protein O6H91_16G007700 [Diphasiastrum complanatum]